MERRYTERAAQIVPVHAYASTTLEERRRRFYDRAKVTCKKRQTNIIISTSLPYGLPTQENGP
jgi:hypothetical protein